MKFKSKRLKIRGNSNKTKIGLIIGAVVLALVLVLVVWSVVQCSQDKKEEEAKAKEIEGIAVASKPDITTYYVGENFDPTGVRIQVVTYSSEYTYFVDWTELTFEGFDSSAVNDAVKITVSYKEFKTNFTVKIVEPTKPNPILERIEIYDFKTEYTFKRWNMGGPDATGAKIRAFYSDGSVVDNIIMKDSFILGYDQLSAPGKTEITVRYNDGVTTVETTVEITVTN